ncbi:MAG: modification methylase [Candidatus Zambryskibacteria bacterium RIFCSPHIGHO2_01_FULL_43_25]|uniref:Modification methylase n=1 Tax=Candidatus Zambryskibacteria bacterium RIFCSPLOWO2_01_FULL_45_21 TaxID=1802761 RepID=A0A1G2U4G1_9BACT|nr:MAG: modification methylase [Candidatus Zambryskibacteria bacterium RIFCSPHIGHO2_01_FULL_43_25]OHB00994.1 MAG: modification methylase [Candidatus Zambryskibacteria bacterium RIFCSPHIGHO2_12_FULL_44_12b]OHB03712.1 MAG: modification methylase [Candidatus Zambryskibacteria bacterium RIFCSPLOWO2_01_FULL_45_21]
MTAKSLNKNLHRANQAKKDEFYTQLVDIEKELKHYKDQFRGKVVYCNCDDPFESNFFKYFASNFNALGLRKLITTSYVKSPIVGGQLPLFEVEGLKPSGKEPFKIEIKEVPDSDKDGVINLDDVEHLLKHDKNTATPLKGNGDFRSDECIELLKQADIVVTNPPFSLFREYIAQLMEYKKKFLILGQQGAIIYKEFFPLVKENKVWLGYDNGGTKWFQVPMDYDIPTESRKKIVNGVKYFSMGSVNWYTNLYVSKRHNEFTLYKKYSPKEYSKYDSYNAINVNRFIDIPKDYNGVMGVPITFLDKHNPDQFEIIGLDRYTGKNGDKDFTVNGKLLFRRLLIKKKK